MAQSKHSNGNQQRSFVFVVIFSFLPKLPLTLHVEVVCDDSTPTLHCILLCPFSSYSVVPASKEKRESVFLLIYRGHFITKSKFLMTKSSVPDQGSNTPANT